MRVDSEFLNHLFSERYGGIREKRDRSADMIYELAIENQKVELLIKISKINTLLRESHKTRKPVDAKPIPRARAEPAAAYTKTPIRPINSIIPIRARNNDRLCAGARRCSAVGERCGNQPPV
ncbi:hypothetical protein EVAR_68526_1 [Eumeta japonica]|uniref:Uncharacterized protein n=1 Tax=Eumeta variegata TaxID=151549 RepID=A0A4C1ZHF2_EUMVA|nr:hypothetical protein EVAR_68526_1 [Eumeta japonica]